MVSEQSPSQRKKLSFADRLSMECINLNLKCSTKDDAIRKLAQSIKSNEKIIDFDRFVSDVFKREKEASTGIGNGVAIPHARTNAVNDFIVAIGRNLPGIAFDAVDGKDVEIIILMGTPLQKIQQYLKLLAHLTNLLKRPGFISGLKNAKTPQELIALFRSFEK